jgi:pyruvate dehydrogenase E2 component (dihydrolipoamide acetyltransferase)
MATRIAMPKLGLTMKEGIVTRWFKNEGDPIKKGEPVVEVMTKKITYKIEAPVDGILLKIVAPKGKTLPIGGLIGVIGAPEEDVSDLLIPTPLAAEARGPEGTLPSREMMKISPAARKLAEENRIDYTRIVGTGPEGRITREDVQKTIAQGVSPSEEQVFSEERPTLKVIPYEGMRKAIGDHMAHSWGIAPKVTHHVDVDLSGLLALRENINTDLKDKDKVSITDLLVKSVARALEMKPNINATLDGEEIKVLRDVNIGVAVAIESGGRTTLVGLKNDLRMDMARDWRRPRYVYEAGRIAYGDLETDGDFVFASQNSSELAYTIVNMTRAERKGQVLFQGGQSFFGLAFDGSADAAGVGKVRYWRDTVKIDGSSK